ncbi:hypothetical protein D3C87_1908340 [compost metagenome]
MHGRSGPRRTNGSLGRPVAGGVDLEHRHHLRQLIGLLPQALCGGGTLFDQCGILLCHLVQVADGLVDLRDALALLGRCGSDLADHVGHLLHRLHDVGHGGTGI